MQEINLQMTRVMLI